MSTPKNSTESVQTSKSWFGKTMEQPLLLLAVVFACIALVGLVAIIGYLTFGSSPADDPVVRSTGAIQFATATTTSPAIPPPPAAGQPSISVVPVAGESGTLLTVTGQNWTPGDTLVIRIDDPTGMQGVQPLFANAPVAGDGSFISSFILPEDTGWANLDNVLVTIESNRSGERVAAQYSTRSDDFRTPTPTVSPPSTQGPPAPAAPTPTLAPLPQPTTQYILSPGEWVGEYYNNPALIDPPVLIRNELGIDFNWGTQAPASSLPADRFSARWGRVYDFDLAVYRFHILANDGVRLWINDELLVEEWYPSARREIKVDFPVRYPGRHEVRLEYVNFSGAASVRFWWEKVTDAPIPDVPPYYEWQAAYWTNVNLFGDPLLVRTDPSINFNWSTGAPAPGLPRDNFSARWLRLIDFEPTTYRFYLTVDEGARVWIDDRLLIDEWRDGTLREVTRDYALTGGRHEVRVEYYERTGNAVIGLRWEKAPLYPTPTPVGYFPDWRGQYWTNANLGGDPLVVRNDPAINFNWGLGAPAPGLPSDNFSARWSRSFPFENGMYRFTVQVDDGVRFYRDGALILDKWFDTGALNTYTVDLNLNGRHWLEVEYYDRSDSARIYFDWQPIGATTTPTPTATPTPSPTTTTTPASATIPVNAAKIDLALRLGVPPSLIGVASVTPVNWTNANLECPLLGPGAEVITPGFLIYLQANGRSYEYHTDQGAYVIFCDSLTPGPPITATPTETATATGTPVPPTATATPSPTATLTVPPTTTPTATFPPTVTPTATETTLPETATPTPTGGP